MNKSQLAKLTELNREEAEIRRLLNRVHSSTKRQQLLSRLREIKNEELPELFPALNRPVRF